MSRASLEARSPSWFDRRQVRELLSDLGLVPRRRLGQSFLVDRQAASKMVEALDPGPGDIVIEIGPGLGALTSFLVENFKQVLAIEVDSRLVEFLKSRYRDLKGFSILHGDVLKLDVTGILKDLSSSLGAGGSLKLIGNLPYRVSTQILFKLLDSPVRPEKMVLAFQWEVAARLMAQPGTKDYGAMTLIVQYFAEARPLMRVKKASFFPQPEVDTGILTFAFRSLDLGLDQNSQGLLFKLVKASFAQRRKTLKNALTNSRVLPYTGQHIEKALAQCGLDLRIRAEDLTLTDFVRVLKALRGVENSI